MASLNNCMFIGNVGKIETRYMTNGVTSQQVPMTEVNCRHYEQQYNSEVHDLEGRVGYRAQCLRQGERK